MSDILQSIVRRELLGLRAGQSYQLILEKIQEASGSFNSKGTSEARHLERPRQASRN